MRVNKEIRAPKVRVISERGEQLGVLPTAEALRKAQDQDLDLVEVAPGASPPVCKIINYGKFRYDQTKREKESKKAQHQTKVKEVKVKPNIGIHDLETKLKHARKFLLEGNKVKISCMFRGREMAHTEVGRKVVEKICEDLADIAEREAPISMYGRFLTTVLAPSVKKKK